MNSSLNSPLNYPFVVIGGGAAGFFGALACSAASQREGLIIERNKQLLSKVRISGGGRCNVTHGCFQPELLVQNYPRGQLELKGPFHRFQPEDTIRWFESRGVALKQEADGRIFPTSNSSETIINCFLQEAERQKVAIWRSCAVLSIKKEGALFTLTLSDDSTITAQNVLLASGSHPSGFLLAQELGHQVIAPIPSLFTFNVPDSPLSDLSGISLEHVHLAIAKSESPSASASLTGRAVMEQAGPFLITHWGFSGPAVLKLSSFGARWLHDQGYRATLIVNWLPNLSAEKLKEILLQTKRAHSSRLVSVDPLIVDSKALLPKNLWKRLVALALIDEQKRWSHLSKEELYRLQLILRQSSYQIDGKTTYKQEFVTCGGIDRREVNFKTMESRLCPGLYFAGEVIDIDGVTGGFNFQNAWSGAWIAGHAIAQKLKEQESFQPPFPSSVQLGV